MKKSVLILIACLWSCSKAEEIFFMRKMNNVFHCDTIFDNSHLDGKRILKVYEQSEGKKFQDNGRDYFRYRLSINETGAWMLLSYRDNKVHLIPEDAIKFPEKYSEELLVDFKSTTNTTWEVRQGGLFGNSVFTVDSINFDTYYLSSKKLFNISDLPQLSRLVISKHGGVKELSLNILGDSIGCKCPK